MITVAIPAYNGSKFLEQAVESVLDQTLSISRILIIDDASTDNTQEKAREIIQKNPGQCLTLLVNTENLGYQANWNRCLDECNTRFLIILHQDDMLKRESAALLLEFLEKTPSLALAGGREELCDAEGRPLNQISAGGSDRIFGRGEIYEFISETSSYIPCSSVMFDMEKIRQTGGFDTDVSGTDELFWPRVLAKFPIAVLGSVLVSRRIHKDQAEFSSFVADASRAATIYRRFRDIALLDERADKRKKIASLMRKKFFAGYIGIIALSLARRGYIALPVRYFFMAFRIHPAGFLLIPSLFKSIIKIKYFILAGLMRRLRKKLTGLSDSFNKYLTDFYFTDKLDTSLSGCSCVLELGAGRHSYLRLPGRKLHITAFDIDQKSLDIARGSGLYDEYVRGDVRNIEDHAGEGSFDCVAAFDLIEHLTKDDGQAMLKSIDRIAKKRIIVYTPNGFLKQDAFDGNIYQEHISGWTFSEMKKHGFRVYGINGLRILRGPLAKPRIRPYFIGGFISDLSWIILKAMRLDRFCFSILCIKNKAE